MPRVYSKGGCNRCKSRRKKCDEVRPVCSACAKWGWSCSYDSSQPRSHPPPVVALELSTNDLAITSRRLPELVQRFGDLVENKVLETIPDLIKTFFSPTSTGRTQDLQVMWQLMLSNNLLRNACIACFSAIMQNTEALVEKSQVTYGRALQSLRSSIASENLGLEHTICVVASVVFLGKLESFGPHSLADPLQHWMALITLLGNGRVSGIFRRRIVPVSVSMLIFESLVYHVGTHAIFSRATERVWYLWQTQDLCQCLSDLNPNDTGRFGRSPLLCGQYELYLMALQVTYLMQCHTNDYSPSGVLDTMQEKLRDITAKLSDEFMAAVSETINIAKHNAECAIYHMFCNSLLICITALREPSKSQRVQIERLADSGMKMFLDLPSYGDEPQLSEHANHFMLAAIWPIEVQGCAAYDIEGFQAFMDHYEFLERSLDAGHQKRARLLFGRVRMCLDRSDDKKEARADVSSEGKTLPAGLKLLRQAIVPLECEDRLIAV